LNSSSKWIYKYLEKEGTMKRTIALGCVLMALISGCGKKADEALSARASAGIPGVPALMQTGLTEFGAALEKQDYKAALLSLQSAIRSYWTVTPLLIQNLRFVKSDGNTYGIYEPRESDEFSAGEPIYLYFEPFGYTLKKNLEGRYEFGFKVDFSLESVSGEALGGQKDFASPAFSSWNFNTEVALTFTYTFSGLDKGKYKVVTTVRDAGSDKSVTCEKWFTII
jgi:hypothetical protein